MSKTRNSEVLASFVAYCEAHPQERFWQALRNWCGAYNWILASNDAMDVEVQRRTRDTFYWEGKDK